jgi:hypothetical protein
MAKMMEVFLGKDGCVSVVHLQTEVGEMARPVQRVHHPELRTPVVMPAEK